MPRRRLTAASSAFAVMLVVCRVGMVVMLLPGLGEIEAPAMVRVGLAVGISLLIYPRVAAQIPLGPRRHRSGPR